MHLPAIVFLAVIVSGQRRRRVLVVYRVRKQNYIFHFLSINCTKSCLGQFVKSFFVCLEPVYTGLKSSVLISFVHYTHFVTIYSVLRFA